MLLGKKMIKIQRISENGLTKYEWHFSVIGNQLVYKSHFTYNRNNKKEKWADERPKPLSFDEWCEKYNKEENCYYSDLSYQEYYNSLNPVLQKTKDGRTKLFGIISHYYKDMPVCPDDVALEAKNKFCEELKVVYQ